MVYKVRMDRLSFNLSREIRWWLIVSLIFGLPLAAEMQESPNGAISQFMTASAQDQNRIAAQKKFEEGETLRKQGTAESLRLAVKKYEEALPLWRAIGDRRGEAATLSNIGKVYSSLGEKGKALDFYTQALPLWRAMGDHRREAASLIIIGEVHFSRGEKQKALDFYTQALLILRAAGDRHVEAITLNIIGGAYSSLGEKQKALDFYTQALLLHREVGGDRRGEATTLTNIGRVYLSLGEKQKALDFYTQALPLRRAAGDNTGEAIALISIGRVYFSLGEKRKALDFYTQALSLWRAASDRRGEAIALNNIGEIYSSLGEEQKALDSFAQALPLLRAVGDDHRRKAAALILIGEAYSSLGEKQKALDFYTQALPLWRAAGDRYREAIALNIIGGVYSSLGEKQKALDFYAQALQLRRAVGDRSGEANTLSHIAYVKRALSHFEESRSHMESALKIIESLRTKVVSQELRASYFATVQEYYEFYVDLLMEMHKQEPTRNHDATALQASERARARSLMESLTEARADIRRGVDPALLARELETQQKLNAKAETLLKLLAGSHLEAQVDAIKKEIDILTTDLQRVLTQIRQTSPRYAALTQPQPLTSAEIQQQALDADTLLLEYWLGKSRSYLWAVTPTSVSSYELPKREVIETAAKRIHELLSDTSGVRGQTVKPRDLRLREAGGQYLAAAASLSQMLLGPVAGQLGKKRLVIVADGMLHYIPFGALPDPNRPKESGRSWQPLIVEHEVVNLPSASTLAALRRELAGRKPATKTLAVLADPVFAKDDVRIKLGARGAAQQAAQPVPNPLNESITRKLVQIAGGAPGDLRIARLPFTRQEAEQILALVSTGAGMKALDFEASRATATSEQLSQYRYVHFATHGLADRERPELSTIVLSLFDEQGRPQDGFLRAHEVYNLNLPAEMVVLSACETGLGKLTRGEGLVSITRGFMYAGAARVVVSLWSVNDQATSELMTKFYRRVLVEGERPATALRAAQIEMWRDKRWESPYYWAAFTLQGEWR